MVKVLKNQLHNFRWKGINASGKKTSGKTMAFNSVEVRDSLQKQNIQIIKINRQSVPSYSKLRHKINRQDITLLTRQFATLLNTGIPLIQAINLIRDNNPKAEMKSVLLILCKSVESGVSISKALQAASPHFDRFYVDMIETGETSGNLAQVFERLAHYREKQQALRSKVIKAMIYPAMVLITSLLVGLMMMTQVIPEFEAMFQGFGASLPWFTELIINVSHTLKRYMFSTAIMTILLVLLLATMREKNTSVRLKLSQFALNCPVVGEILRKASIAKFCRTLATSFSSGIPILVSIQASAKTADNYHYQQAILAIHTDVVAGMPIHNAMRNTKTFPELVLQMILIGEETGKLDDMLNQVAAIYEFEVDDKVDNLGKFIEPLIILFLGVFIGGLVIAMYLPIFNLMSVIS
jgi:type IV pilus assembly protein PilC